MDTPEPKRRFDQGESEPIKIDDHIEKDPNMDVLRYLSAPGAWWKNKVRNWIYKTKDK